MSLLSIKGHMVRFSATLLLFLLLTTFAKAMELHNSNRSTLNADKPTIV